MDATDTGDGPRSGTKRQRLHCDVSRIRGVTGDVSPAAGSPGEGMSDNGISVGIGGLGLGLGLGDGVGVGGMGGIGVGVGGVSSVGLGVVGVGGNINPAPGAIPHHFGYVWGGLSPGSP